MLKKLTILSIIFLSFTLTTNAQLPISLEINGGLANSAFENQESSASTFVLGAAVLVDIIPIIDAGVEFNTLGNDFEFTTEGDNTEKITQTYFGIFGRFDILPLVAVTGYLKGAVGMYNGKYKPFNGNEADFKSAVGFNLGAGVKTMIGVYGEFVYHFVNRELDFEGAPGAQGFNNWMLVVGYQFNL